MDREGIPAVSHTIILPAFVGVRYAHPNLSELSELVDYYAGHPKMLRIASWYELEKAGQSPRPAASGRATQNKIAGIAAAQKAGAITDRFRPEHLLELILGMTRSSLHEPASPAKARVSRKALIEAVERLVRL
jgi:hypothetical protein